MVCLGKPRFHYADFPRDVRDKPVTFPLAQIPLCRLPETSPGSFGEVGVMEFGLYCTDVDRASPSDTCVTRLLTQSTLARCSLQWRCQFFFRQRQVKSGKDILLRVLHFPSSAHLQSTCTPK